MPLTYTGTDNNETSTATWDSEDVKACLVNRDMWLAFHCQRTEMIVTKHGRRMFPTLQVQFAGLNPDKHYIVYFDVIPVDNNLWKYMRGQWVPSSKAGPSIEGSSGRIYIHPDSPNTGLHWMTNVTNFTKVKLTNSKNNQQDLILSSMRYYQPRVHILELGGSIRDSGIRTFVFTETCFVAVTAYQNPRVTQLKIDNNPFAKGFKERLKRTQSDPCSNSSYDDGCGHGMDSEESLDKTISVKRERISPPNTPEVKQERISPPLNSCIKTEQYSPCLSPISSPPGLLSQSPTLESLLCPSLLGPDFETPNELLYQFIPKQEPYFYQ